MDLIAIFTAKYLYLIIVILAFVFFLKLPGTKQKELIVYGVFTLAISFIFLKIASLLYFDPRPFVVGHFIPLIPHSPDNGFPSDHTVLCAAIATVIFPFNKRLGYLLWILTICVGVSRVYAGVHHGIDILASMVIAISVGWIVYCFILEKILQSARYKKISGHYFTK